MAPLELMSFYDADDNLKPDHCVNNTRRKIARFIASPEYCVAVDDSGRPHQRDADTLIKEDGRLRIVKDTMPERDENRRYSLSGKTRGTSANAPLDRQGQ